MKQRNKISFIGCKLCIFLMLALFTGMPLVQVFHHHDTVTTTVPPDESHLDLHHETCNFCYHFSHHQPVPPLDINLLSILYFGHTPTLPAPDQIQQPVLLPGLSWTNKGPPIAIA